MSGQTEWPHKMWMWEDNVMGWGTKQVCDVFLKDQYVENILQTEWNGV